MLKLALNLRRSLPGGLRVTVLVLTGITVGLGLYVVRISEAASYLSDDPKTCINCHIMVPEYASWQRSSHGRDTTCNDCHVPASGLARYWFKATDGGRHSALFTLRKERQVILAIPASRDVIQANCIRCHERVLDDVNAFRHADEDRPCIDCHREVPHGRTHSLSSSPNAIFPELADVLPGSPGKRD